MQELLAKNDDVGVDHIVALGDASASLGLIATLVFSIAVGNLISYESEDDEATLASSVCVFALVAATATSSIVMSFALLEYYYSQMLKSKDTMYMQLSDGESRRAALKQNADQGIINVSDLRSNARNSMWLSLILLQIAAAAHVVDISRNGPTLIAAAIVILSGAAAGMIYSVRRFRAEFQDTTWW